SVRPRESGDPGLGTAALDSRLRGNERWKVLGGTAQEERRCGATAGTARGCGSSRRREAGPARGRGRPPARPLGPGRRGAGPAGTPRGPARRHRAAARHARLISRRRRHCAAGASSTSGERVGLSGLLGRSLRFLLLLTRGLLARGPIRLLRSLPLPACGERVGVRGRLRCFGLRRSPPPPLASPPPPPPPPRGRDAPRPP